MAAAGALSRRAGHVEAAGWGAEVAGPGGLAEAAACFDLDGHIGIGFDSSRRLGCSLHDCLCWTELADFESCARVTTLDYCHLD